MHKPNPESILQAVSSLQSCFVSGALAAQVFENLLQGLLQLTECDGGLILEIREPSSSEDYDLGQCAAWSPNCRPELFAEGKAFSSLLSWACGVKEPQLISSFSSLPPGLQKEVEKANTKNILAVPIKHAGEVLAVALLFNFFEELSQLDSLAPLLGLAGIIAASYREARVRNRTEEALRDSEHQLRQVIDLVPHHIFAIVPDKGGKFIFANKSLAAIYGMTTDEVVGKTQRDITPNLEEEEHFLADDFEVVRSGQMKFIPEETYTDPFGRLHYLQTTKIPFKVVGSNERAVLGICVDITEQKKLEEEKRKIEEKLLQAQKLESLGFLAGGIAHDFNNILTSILGHASLVLFDLPVDSPIMGRIVQIETAAQRAAELCKQMLAYAGRGRLNMEVVNLSFLVREMADILSVSISKKAQLCHLQEENLPCIEADATQIRQVIINLITNASESLKSSGGLIEIETGSCEVGPEGIPGIVNDTPLSQGPYVFLRVKDNGCGMTTETQTRIFDPFFSTKFTGRGLGLAAVLGIVRSHHGAIRIESQINCGTAFTVFFPAVACSPAALKTEGTKVLEASGTVLVVDDEETVRSFAELCLKRFGFKVLLAADGAKAIEVFRQHLNEITVVLLDMTMPNLGGEETLAQLKKICPEIPVVLSSGYNEPDPSSFSQLQFSAFIQKPYRALDLLARIKDAILSRSAGD